MPKPRKKIRHDFQDTRLTEGQINRCSLMNINDRWIGMNEGCEALPKAYRAFSEITPDSGYLHKIDAYAIAIGLLELTEAIEKEGRKSEIHGLLDSCREALVRNRQIIENGDLAVVNRRTGKKGPVE